MPPSATSATVDVHHDVVRWLQTPAAYPEHPERVEFVETHISCVFLAGEQVFKLKKPVRYDFLDFTTLEQRELACHEEVRLNRRLAAHIYLGVLAIRRDADGAFSWGEGEGEVVDWVVQMQRIPTHLTLDVLHAQRALKTTHIDQLAQRLVEFYASLAPLAITAAEYCSRYEAHVRGNGEALLAVAHHLPHAMTAVVQSFQMQLLRSCPELFAARVQAGKIYDGHGDLRPEHICFCEPLAIFDCIEFNADFRRIDVADEHAFLAAECDFIGAAWVGPHLFARYQALSGDQPPPNLLAFYKTYRAAVRAKVAALRADQLTGPAQEAAANEAVKHLQFAAQYAAAHVRPLVLIVGGLSGTGKTTLARAVASLFVAELIRSDVVRQELFPAPVGDPPGDRDIYSPAARQTAYEEVFARASQFHRQQVSVVLDATFSQVAVLKQAAAVATDARAIVLAVECVCSPAVAQERIGCRLQQGDDASEATLAVWEQQRRTWEPWPDEIPQCRVDTEQPLTQQVDQVVAELTRLWKLG